MAGRRDVEAGSAYVRLWLNQTEFERGVKALKRNLKEIGSTASGIGRSMVGVSAAVLAPLALTVKAASDMEETMNKFNIVFGANKNAVKAWGDEYGKQVGRSKQQVADFLASSQDLFVPMGFASDAAEDMSKTVTKLAVDLASFNNKADSDVLRDLHAALTGSGEVMKKYGVIVSEAAVKQELLNMALDPKTATEAEKAQARLNIIIAGTTAAQGDAIRSISGFANQMKSLQASVSDAAAEIGGVLLPIITPMIDDVVGLVKSIGEWATENKGLVATIAKIAAGIGVAGVALVGFGTVASSLAAIIGVLNPVTLGIAAAVGVASAAFYLWGDEIKASLLPVFESLSKTWNDDLLPALADMSKAFKELIKDSKPIVDIFGTALLAQLKTFAALVDVAAKAVHGLADARDRLSLKPVFLGGGRTIGGSSAPAIVTTPNGTPTAPAAAAPSTPPPAPTAGSGVDSSFLDARDIDATRAIIDAAIEQERLNKQNAESKAIANQTLADDTKRLEIEQSVTDEKEKQRRLIEFEREMAIRYAQAAGGAGADVGNINAYYNARLAGIKDVVKEQGAGIGPSGTFSTAAAAAMTGRGGGTEQQRTAKATESAAKSLLKLLGAPDAMVSEFKKLFAFG
jgi:hypothetical protein